MNFCITHHVLYCSLFVISFPRAYPLPLDRSRISVTLRLPFKRNAGQNGQEHQKLLLYDIEFESSLFGLKIRNTEIE